MTVGIGATYVDVGGGNGRTAVVVFLNASATSCGSIILSFFVFVVKLGVASVM